MALCRWSDVDCDVYIYESAQGIECWVASNRIVNGPERPPISLLMQEPPDTAEFMRLNAIYEKKMEEVERAIITSKYAGAHRILSNYRDLYRHLDDLIVNGVLVPGWVMDEVKKEMSDEIANDVWKAAD